MYFLNTLGNNYNYGAQFQPAPVMNGPDTIMISSAVPSAEAAAEASRNRHKEAEKLRRHRINSRLCDLRTVLPGATTQMEKAKLLTEVVQQVKELKRQVEELAADQEEDSCCSGSTGSRPFPGEVDEVSLCGFVDEGGERLLKVTLCCEDRPGLIGELARAVRSDVRVKPIRAEMMTVGGRTKNVVVMKWKGDGGGEYEVEVLKRALKAVLDNGGDSGPKVGRNGAGSGKRAKVYGSAYKVDNDNDLWSIS